MEQLAAGGTNGDANQQHHLDVIPGPSFLGGLFSKLMGGFLLLSGGALVGYFFNDWRDDRQRATMREFAVVEDNDHATTTVTFGEAVIVPITPENSRY
jgi:hypothetical protein